MTSEEYDERRDMGVETRDLIGLICGTNDRSCTPC